MKKLITIIFILLVIFLGMYIYRINLNQDKVTVEDVNIIEEYLSKIYMWKEVTGEALPKFDNINNAPDIWIWEVVKKDFDKYELTYKEIMEKTVDIFGEELKKEFPKEGTEFILYDQEQKIYYTSGMGLDTFEDMFLIKDIKKEKNKYKVEIVEYIEDYADAIQDESEEYSEYNTQESNHEEIEYNIYIRNLEGKTIAIVKNTEGETKLIDAVKENINQFSTKKITLEKNKKGNMIIKKVE